MSEFSPILGGNEGYGTGDDEAKVLGVSSSTSYELIHVVVTSSVSFVSPQAAKLTRSAAPPLPKQSKGLFGDPERPSHSISQLLPILLAPLMTLTPCEIRPSTMNIVLLIGVDSKVSASTVFSLLPIEISPL